MNRSRWWRTGAALLAVGALVLGASALSGRAEAAPGLDAGPIVTAYRDGVLTPYATPAGWTGRTNGCQAGATTAAYRQAILSGLNVDRLLAGVPALTAQNNLTQTAQRLALLIEAAGKAPTAADPATGTWTCYSAAAANAVAGSLTRLDAAALTAGQSVEASIAAACDVRAEARYRLLSPTLTGIGIGHANRADALNLGAPAAPAQGSVIAWPAPGLFPWENLPEGTCAATDVTNRYWSFSQAGVDFAQAAPTVAVTSPTGTQTTAAVVYAGSGQPGEIPQLVWQMPALPQPPAWNADGSIGTADYHVTITAADGTALADYTVTLFRAARVQPGTVTLTNPPRAGQPVTATPTGFTPLSDPSPTAFTYQWSVGDSPTDHTTAQPIAGATGPTYQPTWDDVGAYLWVSVTRPDDAERLTLPGRTDPVLFVGATVWAVSAAVQPGPVSLTGVTVTSPPGVSVTLGTPLTAQVEGLHPADASVTWQWYRDGLPIAGATDASYTVTDYDVGAALTVEATATRGTDPPARRTSAAVTPVPTAAAIGPVSVTGVGADGSVGLFQTVTANVSTIDPETGWLTYQWLRDGEPIAGAIGPDYTTTALDMGHSLAVRVTLESAGHQPVSATSAGVVTVAPACHVDTMAIQGTPEFGQRLIAATGGVDPAVTSLAYQWLRDGQPIADATARSYQVGLADLPEGGVAHQLSVQVTGTAAGYAVCAAVSGVVEPFAAPIGFTLTVMGQQPAPGVGQTSGAHVGDLDPADATVTYRWLRDGQPIPGATARSYTVGADDVGHDLVVEVTATAPGHLTAVQSAQVQVAVASPGSVTLGAAWIFGPAEFGLPLQARSVGLFPADTPLTYRWLRDGQRIPGANGPVYTPTAADVHHRLAVAITAGGDVGGVTRTSPSVVVAPGVIRLDRVEITGEAVLGGSLTAQVVGLDPAGVSVTWQWYCDGAPITGATGPRLVIAPDSPACAVTVRATAQAPGRAPISREAAALQLPAGWSPGPITPSSPAPAPTVTPSASVNPSVRPVSPAPTPSVIRLDSGPLRPQQSGASASVTVSSASSATRFSIGTLPHPSASASIQIGTGGTVVPPSWLGRTGSPTASAWAVALGGVLVAVGAVCLLVPSLRGSERRAAG